MDGGTDLISEVHMTHEIEVTGQQDTFLEYVYQDKTYSYHSSKLKEKGWRWKYCKDLKISCWHNPCGYNIGHDHALPPHIIRDVHSKDYADRTRTSKLINKQQLSNRTVGVSVAAFTTILCGVLGYIKWDTDPNNLKNNLNYKSEQVCHFSNKDAKKFDLISSRQKILQDDLNVIKSHTYKNHVRILDTWAMVKKGYK